MKPLDFFRQLNRYVGQYASKALSAYKPIQQKSCDAIAIARLTTLTTLLTLTAIGFSPSLASVGSQNQQKRPDQTLNKSNIQSKQSKSQIIAQKIDDLKLSNQRWIEIRLKEQRLLAWEGDRYIYGATVSTGKTATPTLTGVFAVQTKLRQTRMRGADYNIPDVPYTMYYDRGYAIHGAYWHNRFGTPISHGCINLKPQQARWLFQWADVGTPIVIRK